MIRLSQIALRRGTKVLLDGADLTLNPGDKIAVIGPNGSGKTSLFALLRGELHADKGEVDYPSRWKVAYVAQETPALDRPALEYAIDGDTTLRRLEGELTAAEAALLIALPQLPEARRPDRFPAAATAAPKRTMTSTTSRRPCPELD